MYKGRFDLITKPALHTILEISLHIIVLYHGNLCAWAGQLEEETLTHHHVNAANPSKSIKESEKLQA